MASPLRFLLAAIVVHFTLFVSIFDIYFTSPIDHGMVPQHYSLKPPAKRLVLFIGDGLRADTAFSLDKNGSSPAPFLRKVVEYTGRWGVSHTHVPTESRPGHVALIAGFYEDISAVTRGWSENPVEFDSVFNQSYHTWSWGSPDILPMFAKGAVPGRVETFMYDAVLEDFADSDPSKLDSWVFEKVEELFDQAQVDSNLERMLARDRIIFFLHLLGIDTNGHAHRPNSQEVIDNLKLVDKGVERITSLVNSYYNDDKTAYVFTSDHGMTDWGSHGAGLPDETMTPLICWGAGVKAPRSNTYAEFVYHDGLSEKWGLSKYERIDVEQADIAALMAVLVGVPIPINSEGVVPIGYLHYNKAFSAEGIFLNARQLLEQLQVKTERIQSSSLPLSFRPFPKLVGVDLIAKRRHIDELIRAKQYQQAIDLSSKLIALCKEGILYYHTYHRFSLKLVITLGFIGWITCILVTILKENSPANSRKFPVKQHEQSFPIFPIVLIAIVWALLLYQSSPGLYYLYYTLPVACWTFVWQQRGTLFQTLKLAQQNPTHMFKGVVTFLLVTGGLQLLVLSFFHREVLSVVLLLVSLWPYFTDLVRKKLGLCVLWTSVSLLLAVFALLPVVGREANYVFVSLSGIAAAGIGSFLLSKPQIKYLMTTPNSGLLQPSHLLRVQLVLLIIASFVPPLTNWFFSQKEGIPAILHLFSWSNLLFSVLIVNFGPRSLPGRLLHIFLALYTVFLLLSTTFEAVFVLLLCTLMYLWLTAEEMLSTKLVKVASFQEAVVSFHAPKVVSLMPSESHKAKATATFEDIRQTSFCLFFGILSFFGIGNIASINTFDPSTVYCFLTVFSPFVMGTLILLKMVIPFIFVSCVYNSIMLLLNRSLKINLLFMVIMSDIMGLSFFFLVRDSGSWLEIGISISHYVIMMVMIIAIVILLGVARIFTGIVLVPRKIEDHLF